MKNKKQKNNKKQQIAIVESLDTKIAKAVYAEKKISERIGLTSKTLCLTEYH